MHRVLYSSGIVFLIAENLKLQDLYSFIQIAKPIYSLLKPNLYRRGFTPERSLAKESSLNISLFLKYGSDPLTLDKDGQTVLHYLAVQGSVDLLELFFQKQYAARSKDWANARNKEGTPVLLSAVKAGHKRLIQRLLEAGADPSAGSYSGSEDKELERLEEASGRITEYVSQRWSLLRRLYMAGLNPLTRLPDERLLGFRSLHKPVHLAAENGDIDVIKILWEGNADLSSTTFYGWTVLHYAVADENEIMVRFLLEKDIDASIQNSCGETAYDLNSKIQSSYGETEYDLDWKIQNRNSRIRNMLSAYSGSIRVTIAPWKT
jgi:ankyrin repeat protein